MMGEKLVALHLAGGNSSYSFELVRIDVASLCN